jgi:hypothetical protein
VTKQLDTHICRASCSLKFSSSSSTVAALHSIVITTTRKISSHRIKTGTAHARLPHKSKHAASVAATDLQLICNVLHLDAPFVICAKVWPCGDDAKLETQQQLTCNVYRASEAGTGIRFIPESSAGSDTRQNTSHHPPFHTADGIASQSRIAPLQGIASAGIDLSQNLRKSSWKQALHTRL